MKNSEFKKQTAMQFPQIQIVNNQSQRDQFSWNYYQQAGLPVPAQYLEQQLVFQIVWEGEVIGGFIIGGGPAYRTFESFASRRMIPVLHSVLHPMEEYSEVCCYWLQESYQQQAWFKLKVLWKVAQTIQQHAKSKILFGTNSEQLARLFSLPLSTRLIHKDHMDGQDTYIFAGDRANCMRTFMTMMFGQTRNIFQLGIQRKMMKLMEG